MGERADEGFELGGPGLVGEPEGDLGGRCEDGGHPVVELLPGEIRRQACAGGRDREGRAGRTKESCLLTGVVMMVNVLRGSYEFLYLKREEVNVVRQRKKRKKREGLQPDGKERDARHAVPQTGHHHQLSVLGLRKVRDLVLPLREPFVEPDKIPCRQRGANQTFGQTNPWAMMTQRFLSRRAAHMPVPVKRVSFWQLMVW